MIRRRYAGLFAAALFLAIGGQTAEAQSFEEIPFDDAPDAVTAPSSEENTTFSEPSTAPVPDADHSPGALQPEDTVSVEGAGVDDQPRRERPPVARPTIEAVESGRSGAFGFRAGPYRPENISDQVAYEDIFDDRTNGMVALDFEWQPLHHTPWGTLGIGVSVGFFQEKGKAVEAETGEQSVEDEVLMIVPGSFEVVYRGAWFQDQPLVPYAGAGLDLWYFSDSAGETVTGTKNGWHWRAGGQLLLDVFEPKAAGGMDNSWGINNTYLFGEYRVMRINNFGDGEGFDLSDKTWYAGLLLEF